MTADFKENCDVSRRTSSFRVNMQRNIENLAGPFSRVTIPSALPLDKLLNLIESYPSGSHNITSARRMQKGAILHTYFSTCTPSHRDMGDARPQ